MVGLFKCHLASVLRQGYELQQLPQALAGFGCGLLPLATLLGQLPQLLVLLALGNGYLDNCLQHLLHSGHKAARQLTD